MILGDYPKLIHNFMTNNLPISYSSACKLGSTWMNMKNGERHV